MVACGGQTDGAGGGGDGNSGGESDSGTSPLAADAQYLSLAGTLTTLDVAVTTDGSAASFFDDSPPVLYHVTDAAAVQDAYRRIFALPLLPASTEVLCHLEAPGDIYELTFGSASGTVLRFKVAPTGNCQWLESPSTDTVVTDADFWAHLSTDIGVDESQFYPPPVPDGG